MLRQMQPIQEITQIIIWLNTEIRQQKSIGNADINHEIAEVYCHILNTMFGCSLHNANIHVYDYPAVDFVDNEVGLAIQITSTSSRAKIQHTMDQFFLHGLDRYYNRLIFLVIGNRERYRKNFKVERFFRFDKDNDIWDENKLLQEIAELDYETIEQLRDYLRDVVKGERSLTSFDKPREVRPRDLRELDRIIRDTNSLSDMIDVALLQENAMPCNYESLAGDPRLYMINHLYVVASPEERAQAKGMFLREGCYISLNNSWLLIFGLSSGQAAAIMRECTGLSSLVIRHHHFEEVNLRFAPKLINLEITKNSMPVRFIGTSFWANLERLCIRETHLSDGLDMQNAIQLRELTIQTPIMVKGLDWCRNLEILNLIGTGLNEIDLDRLPGLKRMSLTRMNTEIRAKGNHGNLTKLWIKGCDITSMTFLARLVNLETLYVLEVRAGEQVVNIPDLLPCAKLEFVSFEGTKLHSVGELPTQIAHLDFRNTGISRIPASLKQLKSLEFLDLSELHLQQLPTWLADLGLPVRLSRGALGKAVLLEASSVEGIDLRTIPEQQELLKEWLEALHDARIQTQNEVKVIFLGDGEAGKSHIIKRLDSNGAVLTDFDGDATPGIAITNKMLDLSGRSVTVRAWDFGGQEILHAMHRIFMTAQSLYVVVLNARNDTQDHRAEHWLRFIYSFDKDAQVMLVLNKIDQNPRASINLNRLRRIYPRLSDVIKMSAKEDSPEEFTEHFINPLRQRLEQFEVLRTPFPKSWRILEEKLEGVNKRYIRERDYKKFCEEAGISKDAVRKELLYRFVNLGVCFRCDEEVWTRSFLLLEPKWVTNAIYKILFNHHKKVFNGIISVADIQDCLIDGESSWSVDQKLSYNEDEVEYILKVMRSYGLSFEMDDEQEREFIPMLCDRNESPLMKEYADDPSVLEVWWQFDYLPDNLLFHLMVELGGEIDTDHVWLNGARFRDPYTQHCMIVERDGSTLKLYAENKPGQGFARGHMEAMERNIRKVIDNRFKGMVEQNDDSDTKAVSVIGHRKYPGIQRLLVHKLNGKRETFDLNRLEENLNCPHHSTLLNTTILARDLLERSYRGMDPEQSMLIQAMVEACTDVQGNRNAHENPRNTYVRDILQAKRYDVRDQTLCGKAEGKNEAGELDMEIRRDPGTPWTIFEALNHSDYDTWKRHLNKLLTNYNPHRLKILFLVTYIDNMSFSAITGRYIDLVKSHAPDSFKCIGESAEELTDIFARDALGIKVWRCNYESDVGSMTVYHFFVHMEESIQPKDLQKEKAAAHEK